MFLSGGPLSGALDPRSCEELAATLGATLPRRPPQRNVDVELEGRSKMRRQRDIDAELDAARAQATADAAMGTLAAAAAEEHVVSPSHRDDLKKEAEMKACRAALAQCRASLDETQRSLEESRDRESALTAALESEREQREAMDKALGDERAKYDTCRSELRRAMGIPQRPQHGTDDWRRAIQRAEDDLTDCREELQKRNRALAAARASAEAYRRAADDVKRDAAHVQGHLRTKLALAAEVGLRAQGLRQSSRDRGIQVELLADDDVLAVEEEKNALAQHFESAVAAARADAENHREDAIRLRDQLRTLVEERTRQRQKTDVSRGDAQGHHDLRLRLDRAEANAAVSSALALLVRRKTKRLKRALVAIARDANNDLAVYTRGIETHFRRLGLDPPPPPDIPFCDKRRSRYRQSRDDDDGDDDNDDDDDVERSS